MEDSNPRKFGTPSVAFALRFAMEVFCTCALSEIWMFTVSMSPTRCARWSWKKARAPVRHRLLAPAGRERGRARSDAVSTAGCTTAVVCGISAEG